MTKGRIEWMRSFPFFALHLLAAGIFLFPLRWEWVGLCAFTYFLRMFAITAGYHRYFSHRSYKMNRVAQFLMAFLGSMALQKGVLWWAAHHRWHHRYSDQPKDIHSPRQGGFWWSHVGWILSDSYAETRIDLVQDLTRYPELVWLNRFHLLPALFLGLICFVIGGLPGLLWGMVFSTVLLWHGTFAINSLSHVFGTRRYQTSDDSRNNFWLALITLGEGWHNNHHCYMSSAAQGFFWWEIDISYGILKALTLTGWIKDLRRPPLALLEAKMVRARH